MGLPVPAEKRETTNSSKSYRSTREFGTEISALVGFSFRIVDQKEQLDSLRTDFFCLMLPWLVSGAAEIGVNYGMVSNNLPSHDKVIALFQSRKIQRLRIFDPNPGALKALEGSGIQVILGTRNEDLPKLASDPAFATEWVNTHVVPHSQTVRFRALCVGNEVISGELGNYVLGAMKNLDTALRAAGISTAVSTAVSMSVIGVSYPPSNGVFSSESASIMGPIAAFLSSNSYPLLVNVYPYFASAGDPKNVKLDYALFTSTTPVIDGEHVYKNLFHAMVDSVHAALEKVGASQVSVLVSETGWPSAGADLATVENAKTYANNLISTLIKTPGTPKRPGIDIETYLFAMFNENQKPVGVETNFGLYRHDESEVYHVNFQP